MTQTPAGPSVPSVSVRGRNRSDMQMLDLDPKTTKADRHYHWVRCRADEHHTAVTKHKLRGYSIETIHEGGVKTVVDSDDSRPDKAIAIGDLILMSCPKDLHEARVAQRKARTEALLASTSAQTEQMAKEKGVRLISDPDHGKVTQETR